MKPQKKNGQGLYLHKKNDRWKWMAGATAATAAGITASEASTITINLVGNFIGLPFNGGNHLNADLTGDGHPDLTIANAIYGGGPYFASVTLNGVQAFCKDDDTGAPVLDVFMKLGSQSAFWHRDPYYHPSTSGTRSLMGSIPIFFKDLHINGGAPTRGSLEVTVNVGYITLDSFTYNTPVQFSNRTLSDQGSSRTVPDQGSSLGLLAMGAGGVLALRQWRAKKSNNPQPPAQAP